MDKTAGETLPTVSTALMSDRDLLLHLVQHAEWVHDQTTALLEQFERYRPLLEQAEQRSKRWGFITGADRTAPAPKGARPGRPIGKHL